MTRHQIAAVFLSLILGAAACGRSDENTSGVPATTDETKTATAPAMTNETKTATKMSNADLENAVKAKLNADEQLRTANLRVSANADKNEITLSGSVESQELHSKAIELAKSAHSGVTVNDQIEGSPGPRSGQSSQDQSGSGSSGTDMAQDRSGDTGGQAGARAMSGHASDETVKQIQEALTDKGHDPGKIDGIMGPNTRAALRAFQKQNNLQATGTIDAKTAGALGVETSAAPSTDGKSSSSGSSSAGGSSSSGSSGGSGSPSR